MARLHRNKYRMLSEKRSYGETCKENENKFVPSSFYPAPYANTDQQFTSKCKVFNIQQFGVMKEKKKSGVKHFIQCLSLSFFKTQKRLKQQHSSSGLKPAGAGAALGHCSFHELGVKTGLIHRTCWAVRPLTPLWAAVCTSALAGPRWYC